MGETPALIGVDPGADEGTYCFVSHPDGTFTDLKKVLNAPTPRNARVPIIAHPVHSMRKLLEKEAPWHLPELERYKRELGMLSKRELSDKYLRLKALFETAAQDAKPQDGAQ